MNTECIEWQGGKTDKGYGRWDGPKDENGKRKKWLAHRLCWTLVNGEIPEGMQINHHCDNPPCVNTDHLYLGTQADNIADKMRRGRNAKGEDNGYSKLTADKVRAIRSDGRPLKAIGSDYGISFGQVGKIKRGEVWAWVA